jgi:hypothetical protein
MAEVNSWWTFRPRPERGPASGDQTNRRSGFESVGEAVAEFADVGFINVVNAKIEMVGQTLVETNTVASEEARTGDRFPDVFHSSPPCRHLAVFMQPDMRRPEAHILQMWLFVNLPLPVSNASLPHQRDVFERVGRPGSASCHLAASRPA